MVKSPEVVATSWDETLSKHVYQRASNSGTSVHCCQIATLVALYYDFHFFVINMLHLSKHNLYHKSHANIGEQGFNFCILQ